MENEARAELMKELLDQSVGNFRTFLAGLSSEDRWRLTDTLYTVWSENRRKALNEGNSVDDSLMELAWIVHP